MIKITRNDQALQGEQSASFSELSELTVDQIARIGAQELLKRALLVEADLVCREHAGLRLKDGRAAVVLNGAHRKRSIQSAAGALEVSVPRINDRRPIPSGQKQKFASIIVPPYVRKTMKIDELIPILYLHGVSSNHVGEALKVLLGENYSCSPNTVQRLLTIWEQEHREWRDRDLSIKEYVYIWADGIYLSTRGAEKQCVLVLLGALKDGSKELIGLEAGARESAESWKRFLMRLQERGFLPGKLFIGDGALGFWKATRDLYPKYREQRCWVHKTRNVLDCLPKTQHSEAKSSLHEIWMANSRASAEKAFDRFVVTYQAKYPKAAECLSKDRATLLTFYDFPAEHWVHIRTTNPIESTFATVRLRTCTTRGHYAPGRTEVMLYKFLSVAAKGWRRLKGSNLVLKVFEGVKFDDGVESRAA